MSLGIYTNYTYWADFKENLHSRSKLSWLNPGILIDNVGWGLSSYFKLDVSHDNSGELAIGVVDIFWEKNHDDSLMYAYILIKLNFEAIFSCTMNF